MAHEYVKENDTFNTSRNGTVPKPTQAEVDAGKVLKADGTWGEGGGGGTVTDVEVNGESVVNEQGVAEITMPSPPTIPVEDVEVNGESVVNDQKVAQIKSYKELTLAEYMALPDTKLTDDVMYCIKDIGSANQFPPLIYSDEEREVGVWIDGKPLYQKTIDFGALPNKTTKTVAHNINDVNGQSFCKIEVILSTSSTGYSTFQRIHDRDVKYQAFWEVTSTGIICYSRENDNSGYIRCFITLTYTKTTDTPGSGTWTTNGTYAKHYSTEEKVIGTWINGKPLYERVIIDSRSGGFPEGTYEVFTDASTFHLIPDGLLGMFYNPSGNQYLIPWASTGNGATSTSLYKNSSGKIVLTIRNDSYRTYALELLLRYTKTTD